MSKLREENVEVIATMYEKKRKILKAEEQPIFDAAIALLKQISKVDTVKALALDSALTLGIASVSLSPLPAAQIGPICHKNLGLLMLLEHEVQSHASNYRH